MCSLIFISLIFASSVLYSTGIIFRGSCPQPTKSTFEIPTIFPDTLTILAPLTPTSANRSPFFANRTLGLGDKSVYLSSSNQGENFTLATKGFCYRTIGTLQKMSEEEPSYEILYQLLPSDNMYSEILFPDCLRNLDYHDKISVYADEGTLIFWTCLNNRPEVGFYDEAMAAFGKFGTEDNNFYVSVLNQMTFSKLSKRNFQRTSSKGRQKEDDPQCPQIQCPPVKSDWKGNVGMIVWLGCFIVVSFVSSSFCGICQWKSRRGRGLQPKARRINVNSIENSLGFQESTLWTYCVVLDLLLFSRFVSEMSKNKSINNHIISFVSFNNDYIAGSLLYRNNLVSTTPSEAAKDCRNSRTFAVTIKKRDRIENKTLRLQAIASAVRLLVDRLFGGILFVLVHLHQCVSRGHRTNVAQLWKTLDGIGCAAQSDHVPNGRKAFVQEIRYGHMAQLWVPQVTDNQLVEMPGFHQGCHIETTGKE